MNKSTYWNLLKSGAVTRLLDVDVLWYQKERCCHRRSGPLGKDVCLLRHLHSAEEQYSGTVRIVLNSSDLSWDIILATLEVDYDGTGAVATTLVTGSDAAIVVAASLLGRGSRRDQL